MPVNGLVFSTKQRVTVRDLNVTFEKPENNGVTQNSFGFWYKFNTKRTKQTQNDAIVQ